MAPRGGFWIIVDGTTPTAFRSRDRDDLVPTLKQLQRTQPATVLLWFDRGRLWNSVEESMEALRAGRARRRPAGRGPEWRPGGAHKDPRARFKIPRDEKRARFKKRQRWPAPEESTGHTTGSERAERPNRPRESKPWGSDKPREARKPFGSGRRPFSSRPGRPPGKPDPGKRRR